MKLTETEVRAPETKQQGRKRNVAFRDTIPALSVYCKKIFDGKVDLIQIQPLYFANFLKK